MLKNQKGFSMMEAVIAAGILGGISVAALTLWENYFKADMGQARMTELTNDLYVLKSFIEDPKACEINLKDKTIGTKLDVFKNANEAVVLKVGSAIGKNSYILESIDIESHNPKNGRTSISIMLKKTDPKGRSQSTIKRFFILTKVKDNKIESCINTLATTADGALEKMCADADPKREWDCEKVVKNVAFEIKEKYCGNHPIFRFNKNTGKCYALDSVKNCQTGYIRGYDADGNLSCYLGPGKAVVPPPVCTVFNEWHPDPKTVCKGTEYDQKRFCADLGVSKTEYRKFTGTKEGCGEAL